MNIGTVKSYNEDKGFGFITDAATGEEYFFHVSGLIDNVKEGNSVTFTLERGKKGVNAINVQLA